MNHPRSTWPRSPFGRPPITMAGAALSAAVLASGCGEVRESPSTTIASGGAAGGPSTSTSSSTSAEGGGGAATTSTTTASTTSTGAGGAPVGAWWKHLTAPDGTDNWMTVPGAMTVDAHGHVVITGRANGPVTFEAAPSVTREAPRALFVAKYDAQGGLVWAKQFGTSLPYSKITGIVTGADDSIVITGHFQGGPLSFGGAELQSAGGTDVFVAKLDAMGEHVWSLRTGGSYYDLGGHVALDAGGGVVAAAEIGSHLAVLWISASGGVILEKQTPGSVSINASFVSPVSGVAVDAEGNAVISGTYDGNGADFGGGPAPSGYEAGFVVSYAPGGAFRWVRTFPTKDGNPVTGEGVSTTGMLASGDSVIVTGNFPKTIDLGAGYGPGLAGSSGFVAALAAKDGAPRWSYALGAGSNLRGMTRAPGGTPALTATWKGAVKVAGADVPGGGLNLLTIAPANGNLVAHRPLAELAGVEAASQFLQPICVDPSGHLALDFGFLNGLDLPLATITQDAMSLEDLLLVHLPP